MGVKYQQRFFKYPSKGKLKAFYDKYGQILIVPYGIPTQNHQQSSSPFQIHIGKQISFWMSLHVKTENL